MESWLNRAACSGLSACNCGCTFTTIRDWLVGHLTARSLPGKLSGRRGNEKTHFYTLLKHIHEHVKVALETKRIPV